MTNKILKISAAGNRFLLADKKWFEKPLPEDWKNYFSETDTGFEEFLKLSLLSPLERKKWLEIFLANKDPFPVDGLVVLKEKTKDKWFCDFYNKDGSLAEMCGNAACCMAVYSKWTGEDLPAFQLGKEFVKIIQDSQGERGISLSNPAQIQGDFPFEFQKEKHSFTLLSAGVPHAVIKCPHKKISFENKEDLKQLARLLRFNHPKSDQGMNVSFFQEKERGKIQALTYERGVENFTLACGTGALAISTVYLKRHPGLKAVTVQMPGGDLKIQTQPELGLFSPVKKGF